MITIKNMDNGATDNLPVSTTITPPITSIGQLSKAELSAVNRHLWRKFKRLPLNDAEILQVHNQLVSLGSAPTRSELTTPPDSARIIEFKHNRADILASKQLQILDAITPDLLANSDLKSLATTFKELANQERLEQGKATSIQGVWAMVVGRSDNKLKERMADMPAIHVEDLNK